MKKFLKISSIIFVMLSASTASYSKTKDCFETVNRAFFSFNMGLDKVIFKPIAKGYSYLPGPIKTGVKMQPIMLHILFKFQINFFKANLNRE